MAVANGHCNDTRKHVQVSFALIIPQPLHFPRVNGQRLLIVMDMVGRQSGLAECLQFLVCRSFVGGRWIAAGRKLGRFAYR